MEGDKVTGWFRWWNGSFSDAKFGLVAMRAKRSVPDVLAVWIALLEHAAQCNERGCVTDCRAEEIAWHLRIEGEAVSEIIAAMTDRGMIVGGRIEAWERRQPSREDAVGKGSKPVAERVAAHRERKKQEQVSERNADVTQCNADVTPQNRTEQNRTEHKNPSGAPNESADKSSQIPGPAAPMPAEVDSPAIDGELLPAPKPQPPAKQQRAESTSAEQDACRATWAAYADAYEQRYGVAPIRNAKVNAAIKGFTRRVGADESPGVARYYLQHQDAFYARKCHDAGLMQQDAEKLRTEWATQRQVTGVAARQQERAGTMLSAVDRILAKREAAA